ncbi:hypothetical protein [Paenibacillus hamazuiensis]|uniref:hypothetical protein n=1 Tax=Paenibacillus hamazuiensis TaxID=2936508 RepID=UPI00200CB4F2|nr:hypothetical protein [Paenibacillus hamazuiensis]
MSVIITLNNEQGYLFPNRFEENHQYTKRSFFPGRDNSVSNSLITAIQTRLTGIGLYEGYKEYKKGPWADTRRILVHGYRVYFSYNVKDNTIFVKHYPSP